jgi:hypothetical protein
MTDRIQLTAIAMPKTREQQKNFLIYCNDKKKEFKPSGFKGRIFRSVKILAHPGFDVGLFAC